MNKITCLIILAVLSASAWPVATAQAASAKKGKATTTEAAKPAAAEVKPAEAKPAAGAEEPAEAGLGFSGDFPFELMRADSIEIDPEGLTILTAHVRIESKDFNISCDQVKMDNKTKMVYATGNPVTLEQGKTVQAKCRNLVYNLETKSANLENEASIIQDNANGTKMQATADKINIVNDPKTGKPKVSLIMDPRSNKPPEIRQIGTAKTDSGKSKSTPATKVNETNLNMLNVPAPRTPGVE